MKGLEELFIVCWMLFGIYTIVLFLIGADLWSGVRKARQRGEMRTSYGYRQTFNKIAKYYNVLLALTFVDLLQLGSSWYLNNYYDYRIPLLPIMTLIGAIGIGLIEIKSIYEKAEHKLKGESLQVGLLISRILKHKSNPEEITKLISEYLNSNQHEKD